MHWLWRGHTRHDIENVDAKLGGPIQVPRLGFGIPGLIAGLGSLNDSHDLRESFLGVSKKSSLLL
ncbi:hypothetical protein D9M69_676550 [compost metagenome]